MNLLLFAKKKLTAGIALALNFTGETLDSRVSFSRTSNATRTNAQGLIEYAPHNLLTYSEQFDNAVWTKVAATISANSTTAPDGTSTADKIAEDTTTNQHRVNITATTVSGATHTLSVYVKTAERFRVRMRCIATSGFADAIFNLNTAQVTFGSGVIQDVGNGWKRLSISGIADGTSTICYVNVLDDTSTLSYTGTAGFGLFLWGAQLNIDSLQPYYTTSVKNLLGYSQNFENAAWTKSNSSVLTNLLTYSQEFDNASWGKTNATVTANAVVAPDGTITADTVTDSSDGVAAAHVVGSANISFVIGTAYTVSIYAKQGTLPGVSLLFPSAAFTSTLNARFNLSTGVIANLDAGLTGSITDIGNGWYRCSATATATATASNQIQIRTATSTTSFYQGNGSGNIYIWGAQLVQGTNPEEYTATTSAPAPIQVMGPLGFLGAEKLVENTLNITHAIAQNSTYSTQPYTLSVYAKAGERSWIMLNIWDGTTSWTRYFNLLTGSVGSGSSPSHSISSIGSGWYRCSITVTPAIGTGQNSSFYVAQSNNVLSYTGDGTSGIYIFGAQLSDSASLDPYVYNFGAAPTSSAYYGPRFDYDPVTLAPKGLLIEEQRINILLNSDTLSTQSVSVTAQAYTLSFYGTGSVALSGAYTGSLAGTGMYPNRVQLTFTPTIGTLTLTVTGSVRYANLEAGAFPTSYIPTTSAQVTRTADNASMVGTNFSSWYTQSEGTVVAEFDSLSTLTAAQSIVINRYPSPWHIEAGTSDTNLLWYGANAELYIGGSYNNIGNVPTESFNKFAVAISSIAGNSASSLNAGNAITRNGIATGTATSLGLGSNPLNSTITCLNGHIKSFKFFSKRLLNSYLQSLTR